MGWNEGKVVFNERQKLKKPSKKSILKSEPGKKIICGVLSHNT